MGKQQCGFRTGHQQCVSEQVRHKPGCTSKKKRLETGNFGSRKLENCTIHVLKTKAMISKSAPLFSHMQIVGFPQICTYMKYRY